MAGGRPTSWFPAGKHIDFDFVVLYVLAFVLFLVFPLLGRFTCSGVSMLLLFLSMFDFFVLLVVFIVVFVAFGFLHLLLFSYLCFFSKLVIVCPT